MNSKFAPIVFALLVGCAGRGPVTGSPQISIDPSALVVKVGEVEVDLVEDCGIEQSLLRREFDSLQQQIGTSHWRVLIFLNQIQAVEIWTDTGRFECGIASKAYGPAA